MRLKTQLLDLYRLSLGSEPASIVDLRADGSDRKIYRIAADDGSTVVGVYGPDHEENRAFLSFSRSFRRAGLPVPEIIAADEASGIYLEEDLGDTTLFSALVKARDGADRGVPESIVPIYRRVVELLPRVQIDGGKHVDYSVAYPHAEFDRTSMMWDLNYFKYHFLKLARVPFNESRLEGDFARLCDFLLEADRSHFLYRDFQSRNIMLRPDASGELLPWLIDYQGGRRGALQYDIASLLYDAKAALPDALRRQLLDLYVDALGEHAGERERFVSHYRGFVLIRIMQAMGAYGYRGYFERKEHFLASVPYAVANIEGILAEGLPIDLPELGRAFERIVARERSAPVATAPAPGLTVRVGSFSYKRGYPEDPSGNGGGFVFDCRALHNPGRYDDYRSLSGCDLPVVEFLEREEGVALFWESVRTLVDNAVENYLARGFSSLSVGFGCTGGQHRSVYFSERLARHLSERFPEVTVELTHRERERWPGKEELRVES